MNRRSAAATGLDVVDRDSESIERMAVIPAEAEIEARVSRARLVHAACALPLD
jgi:hypothetical protein